MRVKRYLVPVLLLCSFGLTPPVNLGLSGTDDTQEFLKLFALRTPKTITKVLDRTGNTLGIFSEENRIIIPYGDIPKGFVDALVATEDAGFWTHNGVSVKGRVERNEVHFAAWVLFHRKRYVCAAGCVQRVFTCLFQDRSKVDVFGFVVRGVGVGNIAREHFHALAAQSQGLSVYTQSVVNHVHDVASFALVKCRFTDSPKN